MFSMGRDRGHWKRMGQSDWKKINQYRRYLVTINIKEFELGIRLLKKDLRN